MKDVPQRRTFNLIVEIGQSHGGDVERAKKALREIAHVQAQNPEINIYAKFQLFSPIDVFGETYALAEGATPPEINSSLSADQYIYLIKYAQSRGVYAFASVFDEDAVAVLYKSHQTTWANDLWTRFPFYKENVCRPLVKIASRSKSDVRLFGAFAELERKLKCRPFFVISCGNVENGSCAMPDWEPLRVVGYSPEKDAVFLYCIPKYPHVYSEADLAIIEKLVGAGDFAGISDHACHNDDSALFAALHGKATWYERHYTDNRETTEIDAECSLEIQDLLRVVARISDWLEREPA